MVVTLWILNIILAIVFVVVGFMHAFSSPEKMVSQGLLWVKDVPPATVKLIGALEIIGAAGLILPIATGIAPILAPVAAIGLAIVMAGAIVTHARRKESWVVEAVLCLAAITSAIVGFMAV